MAAKPIFGNMFVSDACCIKCYMKLTRYSYATGVSYYCNNPNCERYGLTTALACEVMEKPDDPR